MSIRKVSKEPVRNFPPSNGNLWHFSVLSVIARDSGIFRHKEYLLGSRTVHFRKAPARLFWGNMKFPDGIYLSAREWPQSLLSLLSGP